MHDLPGNRRTRTDKLFGGLSVALLLTVGAMMIALAWSQTRPSPISQPAQPGPPQTALTAVSTEILIAVAKTALPPPPSAPARATVVKAHAEPSNLADREVVNRPALEPIEIVRIDMANAGVLQERVFASQGPRSEPPATPRPEITVAARASPVPRFESLAPTGPKTLVAREIEMVVPPLKNSTEKIPERRQQRVASPQGEQAVTNVAATIADGRALLRILEHGKGPSIEIAWPTSARLRSRLYRVLVKCYGLQPGIVSANDAAYVLNARTGEITPLDLDRTSGFVRVVSGASVAGEVAAFGRLRRALADVANSTTVRTFPRRFDAMLLGGLRVLVPTVNLPFVPTQNFAVLACR